jgi:hypothetical protein
MVIAGDTRRWIQPLYLLKSGLLRGWGCGGSTMFWNGIGDEILGGGGKWYGVQMTSERTHATQLSVKGPLDLIYCGLTNCEICDGLKQ